MKKLSLTLLMACSFSFVYAVHTVIDSQSQSTSGETEPPKNFKVEGLQGTINKIVPYGKKLFISGTKDKRIFVHETTTGKLQAKLGQHDYFAPLFDVNGSELLTTSKGIIKSINCETYQNETSFSLGETVRSLHLDEKKQAVAATARALHIISPDRKSAAMTIPHPYPGYSLPESEFQQVITLDDYILVATTKSIYQYTKKMPSKPVGEEKIELQYEHKGRQDFQRKIQDLTSGNGSIAISNSNEARLYTGSLQKHIQTLIEQPGQTIEWTVLDPLNKDRVITLSKDSKSNSVIQEWDKTKGLELQAIKDSRSFSAIALESQEVVVGYNNEVITLNLSDQ